ncbi:putative Mitochondrial 2-oxoglutarate/malate carrier protein [Operophtera brumata]|uniref:Putative Mitochondrial 2-oxoglutarate/malate carrier protein n=1 Tax=Operophtera brumata TaxID=104452 RepID=A0A0L7LD66_OPEBR|nr:putative Mitochondrial 2-oxoglutarate/malate carrier protein [Operophtera brumata]
MLATTIVHPLDVLKVRMQVFPDAKSTLGIAMGIVRCDGIPALYTGLSAGLMRQATYTTTRLGVYYWMYEEYRTITSTEGFFALWRGGTLTLRRSVSGSPAPKGSSRCGAAARSL